MGEPSVEDLPPATYHDVVVDFTDVKPKVRTRTGNASEETGALAKPSVSENLIRDPARRLKGLQHIRVRKLSEAEIAAVDPGLVSSPLYEDDPPWHEIAKSIRLPSVAVRQVYPDYTNFIPCSKSSLLSTMTTLATPGSTPPIADLMRLHKNFERYQSNASFNFLVSLALQQDNLRQAKLLLRQVAARGWGNMETRKLRTRLMIRSGQWMDAWMSETSHGARPLPFPIWTEFMQGVKEPVIKRAYWYRKLIRRGLRPVFQTPDPRRVHLLMRNFPLLLPGQLAEMPPRAIFDITRWMLHLGQYEQALQISMGFFRALPPRINSRLQRICMNIIHLHLLPRRVSDTSEHAVASKTLGRLLSTHQAFRPNATTLYYLLRTLRRAQRRTVRAMRLIQSFRKRWGPCVVDDRVLRRLMSFALSEKKLGLCNAIWRYREMTKPFKEREEAQWQDVRHRWTTIRKSHGRYPHRRLFAQRGAEDYKWKALIRRLARKIRNA
ncbi:hypothetical protein NM688_g5268 [Phlebia brevispora]|uniref:Uncharacterized protein n=1 Tax=Phlebia brevispora TaxID=194682 RepID=A0ACC1SXZ8_9APHY|nr:hypothetical protein NM688_g5268 [Phlebia brevispora]